MDERIYGLLLRVFPRAFREDFEQRLMELLGIYAVVSFGVTQRVTEVGIRMALGAEGGSVLWLFLHESAGVIGLGTVVGALLAWPLAGLIGPVFTGAAGVPVRVVVVCVATLALAAFGATILPARRASRLDPMRALRVKARAGHCRKATNAVWIRASHPLL